MAYSLVGLAEINKHILEVDLFIKTPMLLVSYFLFNLKDKLLNISSEFYLYRIILCAYKFFVSTYIKDAGNNSKSLESAEGVYRMP